MILGINNIGFRSMKYEFYLITDSNELEKLLTTKKTHCILSKDSISSRVTLQTKINENGQNRLNLPLGIKLTELGSDLMITKKKPILHLQRHFLERIKNREGSPTEFYLVQNRKTTINTLYVCLIEKKPIYHSFTSQTSSIIENLRL